MTETINHCGTCGMCCKLPVIDDRKLKKPFNQWCPFWKQDIGCTDYDNRPESCATYFCLWYDSQNGPEAERWPEAWRPDRCKAIFSHHYDTIVVGEDGGLRGGKCIGILVTTDPRQRGEWQQKDRGRLFDTVKRLCAAHAWILQE